MKQATFFLLDTPDGDTGLSSHEALACQIAAERCRAGKRVLLACALYPQIQLGASGHRRYRVAFR